MSLEFVIVLECHSSLKLVLLSLFSEKHVLLLNSIAVLRVQTHLTANFLFPVCLMYFFSDFFLCKVSSWLCSSGEMYNPKWTVPKHLYLFLSTYLWMWICLLFENNVKQCSEDVEWEKLSSILPCNPFIPCWD